MLSSRNSEVKPITVSAVEGKPTYGGNLVVKPLIKGDQMTFLEIHYAAGVGAPLHTHTHEFVAYVVKGKVKSTVGEEEFIMGPGDVCRPSHWRACMGSRRSKSWWWWRSNRQRLTSAPSSRCARRTSGAIALTALPAGKTRHRGGDHGAAYSTRRHLRGDPDWRN